MVPHETRNSHHRRKVPLIALCGARNEVEADKGATSWHAASLFTGARGQTPVASLAASIVYTIQYQPHLSNHMCEVNSSDSIQTVCKPLPNLYWVETYKFDAGPRPHCTSELINDWPSEEWCITVQWRTNHDQSQLI